MCAKYPLLVSLLWLFSWQPMFADEKADKERRDKQLAELDARAENTELAKKNKASIVEFKKHLENSHEIDAIHVNGKQSFTNKNELTDIFHSFEWGSQYQVIKKEKSKEIGAFTGNILHWNPLRMTTGFDPHYGIRATTEKRTLSFLICFESNRVQVFEGTKQLAELATVPLDGPNRVIEFIADTKKERKAEERRDEEKIAKWEATAEDTEHVKNAKLRVAYWAGILSSADRVDVLRVGFEKRSADKVIKNFHDYPIISEFQVPTKEQSKEITTFLGKTLHWNSGREALCFSPRHGLRVAVGKKTYDFLICFECSRVNIFEDDKLCGSMPLGFVEEDIHPIEKFLLDSEKNARKRK